MSNKIHVEIIVVLQSTLKLIRRSSLNSTFVGVIENICPGTFEFISGNDDNNGSVSLPISFT